MKPIVLFVEICIDITPCGSYLLTYITILLISFMWNMYGNKNRIGRVRNNDNSIALLAPPLLNKRDTRRACLDRVHYTHNLGTFCCTRFCLRLRSIVRREVNRYPLGKHFMVSIVVLIARVSVLPGHLERGRILL